MFPGNPFEQAISQQSISQQSLNQMARQQAQLQAPLGQFGLGTRIFFGRHCDEAREQETKKKKRKLLLLEDVR